MEIVASVICREKTYSVKVTLLEFELALALWG